MHLANDSHPREKGESVDATCSHKKFSCVFSNRHVLKFTTIFTLWPLDIKQMTRLVCLTNRNISSKLQPHFSARGSKSTRVRNASSPSRHPNAYRSIRGIKILQKILSTSHSSCVFTSTRAACSESARNQLHKRSPGSWRRKGRRRS